MLTSKLSSSLSEILTLPLGGPWKGGVRSRFYWRGHGEVTKKNEVKGQRAETVRGHEIFKYQMRGLGISMILLRGHQDHS